MYFRKRSFKFYQNVYKQMPCLLQHIRKEEMCSFIFISQKDFFLLIKDQI